MLPMLPKAAYYMGNTKEALYRIEEVLSRVASSRKSGREGVSLCGRGLVPPDEYEKIAVEMDTLRSAVLDNCYWY